MNKSFYMRGKQYACTLLFLFDFCIAELFHLNKFGFITQCNSIHGNIFKPLAQIFLLSLKLITARHFFNWNSILTLKKSKVLEL